MGALHGEQLCGWRAMGSDFVFGGWYASRVRSATGIGANNGDDPHAAPGHDARARCAAPAANGNGRTYGNSGGGADRNCGGAGGGSVNGEPGAGSEPGDNTNGKRVANCAGNIGADRV